MHSFCSNSPPLRHALPATKLLVAGVVGLALGLVVLLGYRGLANAVVDVPILGELVSLVGRADAMLFGFSLAALCAAAAVHLLLPDTVRIRCLVRRGLFSPAYGNPLHLRDGELLPRVKCGRESPGVYELTIDVGGSTVEAIAAASSNISSSLNKRYRRYAVVQTDCDVAFNEVRFVLDDVLADKSFTFHDVAEMKPDSPTKLAVQNGTYIDLETSGSMLAAGKTRSGKTTGIIALLLQVLLAGPDEFGSEVIIIDPKQAELSRLPHVVTLDEDGEGTHVLNSIRHFAEVVKQRQGVLNELSEKSGDAVKWWDAGMHPSFLFLDEYVSLRDVFPAKANKDNPGYCLAAFDKLVKRIVTMGASAGCFVIISIAEASVESAGLPSMLRSAMSTKILFRPTRQEGILMWSKEKLDDFASARVYKPGDAWFSSTDGEHDNVCFAHFPRLKFRVYGELGRLLNEYYKDTAKQDAPPAAE